MRKSKPYQEIKNDLDKIKNEIIENCQEQLKQLEPEYKKINLEGPFNENDRLIMLRYNYYKAQEERLKEAPEDFSKRMQKQAKEIFTLMVRYHVKYHKVIGEENPEYLEKYEKHKKDYEDFLLANNDNGKLFDYLAINETDVERIAGPVIDYTVGRTIDRINEAKEEPHKELLNVIKKIFSDHCQEMNQRFEEKEKSISIINSQYEMIHQSINELDGTLRRKMPISPLVLPELESLNKLTEGETPILRKWTEGKYKCSSLPKFIKAYVKIADNLTPALIRDYLISEKTGKPYTDKTIEKDITLNGLGRN